MKIIFQGDSITDCERETEQNGNRGLGFGYVNLIASELLAKFPQKSITIINKGTSGNRVLDLYARWKKDVINENPDVLSILIGINDIWHKFEYNNGIEPLHYKEIYRKILSWTKESCPKVKIILGIPFALECGVVTSEWISELIVRQEIVRELAIEFNTEVVEYQDIFSKAIDTGKKEYWLEDGVHPTLAGHYIMAKEWIKVAKL